MTKEEYFAIVLASATEWHLAELEHMGCVKSTRKAPLKRKQDICAKLVQHCSELGVTPRGLRGDYCVRLEERMEELAAGPPIDPAHS
jgi:hypothetical protein